MNPVVETLVASIGLRNTFRVLGGLVIIIGLPCCAAFKQPDFDDDDDDADAEDLIMEDCEDDDEAVLVGRRRSEGGHADVKDNDDDDTASESSWLADMIRREKDPQGKCCFFLARELWLNPIFLLFMLGQFIKGIGYVFPFIHLVNYMTWLGIKPSSASWVMTMKGAADMVGRMAAGVFGERLPFPLVHVFVLCCGIMAVVTYVVVYAHDIGLMMFYAFFIGFCNGVYNALIFPMNTALFSRDVSRLAWSYINVPPGVAIIVGPTVAGAIYDATNSYYDDFYVNTCVFLVAMVIFTMIPIIHLKRRIDKKKREAGTPRGLGEASNIIEMTKLFIRGSSEEANGNNNATNYGAAD